jgi:tRNA (cmo5U34)-methyltransferase
MVKGMNIKDRLFDTEINKPADFVFDERVVKVFPDMIRRSVPGYGLIIPMIGLLSRRYAQPDSVIYDLGCSLGAATLAIRTAVNEKDVRIVAVDNSAEMVARFRDILEVDEGAVPVELQQKDICDVSVENASVVILNLTLQFLEPGKRLDLLRRIALGMNPDGMLLLTEKIHFKDNREQQLQTTWHHDFKRAQGYSELEISGKRNALENILKPDTGAEHFQRLHEAGFRHAYRWFQCFSFTSFIAFR